MVSASYCDEAIRENLQSCLDNCLTKKVCSITEECLETFYPFVSMSSLPFTLVG